MKKLLMILGLLAIIGFAVWDRVSQLQEKKLKKQTLSVVETPPIDPPEHVVVGSIGLVKLADLARDYDYNKIGGECVDKQFVGFTSKVDDDKIYKYYRGDTYAGTNGEAGEKNAMDESLTFSEKQKAISYVTHTKNNYYRVISFLKDSGDKITTGDTLLDENDRKNAYFLKGVVFIDKGFIIDMNGYCFQITSLDKIASNRMRLTEMQAAINKRTKDSLSEGISDGSQKVESNVDLVGVIKVNVASIYNKNYDNSMSLKYGTLQKDTKLNIMREWGEYYYCEFRQSYSYRTTGWISKYDVRLTKSDMEQALDELDRNMEIKKQKEKDDSTKQTFWTPKHR